MGAVTMWTFRKMSRAEINQDPVHNEFFGPEEGYTAALVRETIQNSLDARAGAAAVEVCFRFGSVDPDTAKFGNSVFFSGLRDHLFAQQLYAPRTDESIPYLTIEDFGTRGLRGDPSQDEDREEEPGNKNDFYYFWRNVGRSQKEGVERGRWGLGKTVFPASSQIHAFFGLSVRAQEPAAVLLGQCVGRMHQIGDVKYPFYGYFADHQADGFALPFTDVQTINHFRELFQLGRKDEFGLSIVVPFPQADIEFSDITREVILSYYVPIIRGELRVRIQRSDERIDITEQSVEQLAQQADWRLENTSASQVLRTLRFARETLQVEEPYQLRMQGGGSAPTWNEEAVRAETWWPEAQQRFDSGNLVAFEMPLAVTKQEFQSQDSFYVYLQRDPELTSGRGDFVRQGLAITQGGRQPKAGVRGLLLVSGGALSVLLGDSENPAHTKWQERSHRVREYKHGAFTIRFIIQSLVKLSEFLSAAPAGLDKKALEKFFFVQIPPDENPESDEGAGSTDQDDTTPPIIDPPRPSARPFRLERIRGGFRITSARESDGKLEAIQVRTAYAVRRGSAFKKYVPSDFKLTEPPIEVRLHGARAAVGDNTLEILVDAPDFVVEVAGFDQNRDLEVTARGRRTGEASL